MTIAYDIMHVCHNALHAIDLAAESSIDTTQDWIHEATIYNFTDGSALFISNADVKASLSKVIPLYSVTADPVTGEWLDEPKYLDFVPAEGWHQRTDTPTQACETYEHDGQTRALLINWATSEISE